MIESLIGIATYGSLSWYNLNIFYCCLEHIIALTINPNCNLYVYITLATSCNIPFNFTECGIITWSHFVWDTAVCLNIHRVKSVLHMTMFWRSKIFLKTGVKVKQKFFSVVQLSAWTWTQDILFNGPPYWRERLFFLEARSQNTTSVVFVLIMWVVGICICINNVVCWCYSLNSSRAR